MLFSVLKNVTVKGKLDILDANDILHSFGDNQPYVKIKLINKSIERKLFFNPSLYLGEGYMNGEIIVQKGLIEDFINIFSSSYNDFSSNNLFFHLYGNISNFFKSFQQINEFINSKKNVAHHYDLKEDLYKLFLDKYMQYYYAYFFNYNISLDQA